MKTDLPSTALSDYPGWKTPYPWLVDGLSREMLFEFHLSLYDGALEKRRHLFDNLTVDSWQRERERLRRLFREMFGPFPEKCDLAPRTTKCFDRDGYRVENVIFESVPGLRITANLYLPEALDGQAPGIALACGHSGIAKAYSGYQLAAIDMARRGMVVLCFDPFGQGERLMWDRVRNRTLTYPEHDVLDRAAVLAGTSSSGQYTWDCVRSIDYLTSRPEVDEARIGLTGCSGGGTQTTFAATVEDRIAAAVPICFVTSVRERLLSRDPGDSEQYPYNLLKLGLEYADFLAMLAPKPVLIAAAKEDYFPLKGARDTVAALKGIYALTGDAGKVDLFEGPGKHGLSDEIRRATSDWFCRWFGLPIPDRDPAAEPEPEEALWATRSGQLAAEGSGKNWYVASEQLVPSMEALREKRVDADELRRTLALPPLSAPSRFEARRQEEGVTCLRVEAEPGITVPAVLFDPGFSQPGAGGKGALVLYCHEDGMQAESGPAGMIEQLRGAGCHVLAFDPRGVGLTRGEAHGWWGTSTAPHFAAMKKGGSFDATILGFNDPAYEGPMATECEHSWTARMLGRPLLGQRVHDLLCVLEVAETLDQLAGLPVVLAGSGVAALWALYASPFASERVQGLILHAPLASYRLLLEEPRATWHHQVLVRNLPAVADCPAALKSWSPRSALAIDPCGAFRTPISTWEAERIFGGRLDEGLTLRWTGSERTATGLAIDYLGQFLSSSSLEQTDRGGQPA